MSKDVNSEEFLQFGLEAVWEAGRITLGHFQTGVRVVRKSNNTPVTIADEQAEKQLRARIEAAWPDHAILGEEYGETGRGGESRYTWIIDPIDGTKSFISGVPLYATLLALTDSEQPLLGIAHFPALGETIYAVRGQGCYRNGRRTRVSTVERLEDAVLLTSELNYFGLREAAWQRLVRATYAQRTWGDAYGYFLVATGQAEIMLDAAMAVWDCGPLQVILEEAGGTFTDWKGNATIYGGESIATNGLLYDQVMALVEEL